MSGYLIIHPLTPQVDVFENASTFNYEVNALNDSTIEEYIIANSTI